MKRLLKSWKTASADQGKKVKPNYWDYSTWGVEKYGYTVDINPVAVPYAFAVSRECIIDVENYKDGRFAGLGVAVPDCKILLYFTDVELAHKYFPKGVLVGHVLRTDIHKLKQWGFDIDEAVTHYDTALIEHLQDSTKKKYGLKELAKTKFGIEYPSYEKIVGDGDFDTVPVDVAANYNGMDLIATYELFKVQNGHLKETAIYSKLLWPLGRVLTDMEERGLKLDLDHLRRLEQSLSAQSAEIKAKIQNELGDINLSSPKQLLEALHAKGINPKFKGKASTDKRGMQSLKGNAVVDQLLKFSELDTLLSSFVTPYLEIKAEVINPRFGQMATRTGRLGCYAPNLQQVPTHTENGKKLKQAFVARSCHKLVEIDYSAIEPRMLAHFSKSKNLCELFNSGVNFHDYTRDRLKIDRQAAKVLNLSTGYRATKYGLAYQLKCSVEEAEKQLNDWWALWPDLYLWEELLINKTKQLGYVSTLYGRKIYIDKLDSSDRKERQTAERRVIENLAQGSTSDLIGLAMVELYKQDLSIINQVHDSLVFEFPENKVDEYIKKACTIMTEVLVLEVPIEVSAKVGRSWGDMHEVS